MFRRILLATDFSESAEKTYGLAARLAKAYDGEITVLHVLHNIHWSPYTQPAEEIKVEMEMQQKVEELLNDVCSRFEEQGIKAQAEIAIGTPRVEIVAAARRINAHVIIIGSHGHNGIYEMVIGSTTERVVRQSTCPVLVVSSFAEKVEKTDFERILFPTDLTDTSTRHAETIVFGMAPRLKELHLVHVLRPPIAVPVLPGETPITITPDIDEGLEEKANERLTMLKERIERLNPNVKVLPALRFGLTVSEEVMAYRKENDLEMIAIPASRNTVAEPYYLGMVAERLLKEAKVPVLVMK